MQKYEQAFGKNDIRGIFGQDITEELFYNIGLGFVEWLKINSNKKPDEMKITVCRDARLHSPQLANALICGVSSTGAKVVDLGLCPTPLGYYSEAAANDVTSAMIVTASHNPKEYNGLKMTYNRQTLNENQIKEVKELTFKNWQKPDFNCPKAEKYNIIPDYINDMLKRFGKIGESIKVVVDSANATGGIVAPELYKKLGCEVVELFSEPDGNFPNHHPNPSDLKTLDTIKKTVVETGADVGIAFDGDSDRIGVITSEGQTLTGDKLLLIYATDLIKNCKEMPTVVSEVKCSQVLFDTINSTGAKAVMCKTGHGYVKEKMKETGAVLAGEMSGHTFFKDRYFGFDDAIYAGCRIIEIISKNKAENPNFKLSDLLKPFNAVYTSDEVRFPCPNELKKPVMTELKEYIEIHKDMFSAEIKDIITLDGMRIVFDGGFALIRQSNTEPVFTLRFEAKTKEMCEHFKKCMLGKLDEIIKSKL